MYNLSKKQKIVLGIIVGIIMIFICYYVYSKDDNLLETSNENLEEGILDTEEMEDDDESSEEYSDTTIFVHITGAINKEGVYELSVNSRIDDIVNMAEGFTQEAYTDDINLAYKLEDGMKIHIPTKQEHEEEKNMQNLNQGQDSKESYITTSSGVNVDNKNEKETKNSDSEKININSATQTELEMLPGIGPSTSGKIIKYREENGDFKSIDELKNVSGIGDAKFNNIKDKIEI